MLNNTNTMENARDLQVFKNNDLGNVRISKDENSEPWFCLKDICNCLGLSNIGQVKSRLDEEEVKILNITEMSSIIQNDETSKGGNPNMAFVNEAGMYDVIIRSDSPKAKPFRKWVCSEVLPSIRKHGAYMTAQTIDDILKNPDLIIGMATELKKEQEANKKLQVEAKENEPKVKFANALMCSESSILVNQMASILTQNGHKIGQNRLFEWLRKNDYLHENTENRNLPKQKWIEKGYFEIKTSVYFDNKAMALKTKSTPKITMKGVEHILNAFDNETVPQALEQI